MQERREKGLCFNYNEKFNKTHKCKAQCLVLLSNDEVEDSVQYEDCHLLPKNDHGKVILDDSMTISYLALTRNVVL